MRNDTEHLDDVITHQNHVRENTIKIGKALFAIGRHDLGRRLIARGHVHDYDKFFGIQWKYMRKGNEMNTHMSLAIEEHVSTNSHHPEYHGSIHLMEELDIAELVCDWGARSTEFKTGLQEYIDGNAMEHHKFTKDDKVYKTIMYFKDMLCDKPFERKV